MIKEKLIRSNYQTFFLWFRYNIAGRSEVAIPLPNHLDMHMRTCMHTCTLHTQVHHYEEQFIGINMVLLSDGDIIVCVIFLAGLKPPSQGELVYEPWSEDDKLNPTVNINST